MVESCVRCGKSEAEPKSYKSNTCNQCSSPKELGFPSVIEKVFIREYGHTEKSRINEMKRRRVLPDRSTEDGKDYYVGRIGENGKIQDKEPSY